MGVVERVFGWLVTVLLLASFTVSGAFATPPDIGDPKATILGYIAEPVKIGETQLIPIDIGYMPKFKYGIIKFNKISPSVDIDDIILDPNQKYPHRIYVPVTVTGEGLFDIKGNITVEALDGEKFTNDESSWSKPVAHNLGIFAFDGEVFFGGSGSSAMEAAAVNSLKKTNSEYNKLLNKKESIDKGTSRQTFSEEENEKLKRLIRKEQDNIGIRYFEKYAPDPSTPVHIKDKSSSSSTSMLLNTVSSNKYQKGEIVNLEVNWSIDSTYTSFLPLHGAQIAILPNDV